MSEATGPGAITADGCAVDVYLRLPVMGEPELIDGAVPAGASILDLGAGVGRVADPLVALGHRVVAVDDSPDMLAHVRAAEPVLSTIEELALGERFGAVVMASNLANTPDERTRRALFAAARRHADGLVLCQWHTPDWFDALRPGPGRPGQVGPVTTRLDVHTVADRIVDATVEYQVDGHTWTQRFRARRFDEAELAAELAANGLVFDRFLTDDRSWFAARPVPTTR
jgi:SAM-dependent methyltransferase